MDRVTLSIVGSSIVIFGLILAIASQNSPTGGPLGDLLPEQTPFHLPAGQKATDPSDPTQPFDYNSNPPSSGPHWASPPDDLVPSGAPARWGIYEDDLPDEVVLHNMEHGDVIVRYHPEKLSAEDIKKLKDLVRTYRSQVVMSPRAKNDRAIGLTSWTRQISFNQLDDQTTDQIKKFLRNNRDLGPEKAGPMPWQ